MFCFGVLLFFLVFVVVSYWILDVYAKSLMIYFTVAIGSYLAYYMLKSLMSVNRLPAGDAAWHMFNNARRQGPSAGSDELPEHLKGVFWFETNAAPELLMTLENSGIYRDGISCYNGGHPYINVNSGGSYSWAHSADCIGWSYWAALRCSWICCSELHLNFKGKEMTSANMPLYVCGGCPDDKCPQCDGFFAPMGMWWDLKYEGADADIDGNGAGNTWARPIYLYCCGSSVTDCCKCNPCMSKPIPWELGSYKLVRIIDGEGKQLPAFDRMTESVDLEMGVKVKGIYKKPPNQLVNGNDWQGNVFGKSCCSCCGGGEEDQMSKPFQRF